MAELNIFHYWPQNSVLHAMDGRIKLICMILFSVAAGIATRVYALTMLTLVLLLALAGSRLPVKRLFIEIRYFLFLIGLVILTHSLSIPGAPIITDFPLRYPNPTWEGLRSGLIFGWRIILIVIIGMLLTGTTTLSSLKNTIEWFLRPIPFIRAARVGTMFSLTFILVPLIFDQASEILNAQKSRCIGARKNPVTRIIFLIYPLLFHTFMWADEMVYAMESRCYSEERTPAVFKTTPGDWLLLIFTGLICIPVFIPYRLIQMFFQF